MNSYLIISSIIILILFCDIYFHKKKIKKNKSKEEFKNKNNKNKINKGQKYEKIPNNFRNFDKLKIDNFDNHNKCFTCPQKKN